MVTLPLAAAVLESQAADLEPVDRAPNSSSEQFLAKK